MKRLILLLLVPALALSVCACGETQAPDGLTIVTTVFPAYDFARAIAGERASLTLLLPPGAEAHSFEPTARDVLRIRDCDLFFYTGGESEAWAEELLAGQDAPVNSLRMLACVNALEEEVREGMQAEREAGGEAEFDEHVWTSPVNAIAICRALAETLSQLDPEGAAVYAANCEAYCAELAALDRSFRDTVAAGQRRTVIFADRFPARYFVEEYGLDYYAAFPGCAEDTEPAAGTVAFLIDKVREGQIPAVFYIEFSNEKMADAICEDTGCRKLLFHSCHSVSAAQLREGVSYLELMRGNVESLREALA